MQWQEYIERYGLNGDANIVEDAHFGIVNGHLTTNVGHSNVLSLRGLYAPPFASSDFIFDGWVCGETVKTECYSWLPLQVRRAGKVAGLNVESTLTLVAGERAFILEIQLHNTTGESKNVPLHFDILGGLDYVTSWDFARPVANKACQVIDKSTFLIRRNDTGAVVLGAHGMYREGYVPHWKTSIDLAPQQTQHFWLVLAMGEADAAQQLAERLLENPAREVQRSCEKELARTKVLLGKLPRLQAADKRLEKFYDRSALHLMLNQWNVPEFLLHPYYSTGSVIGGCVCSYLWDFGSGWEIFPLVDPDATREHIKTFLRINLTRHFAFNPISGAGWGPWYYINQEKIIYLIYYYVQLTGDVSFLQETVNGKSTLEWVIYYALWGDDLEEKANLIDYGNGNHHLELRREYRYDNYLPDMNARRYSLYYIAQKLCDLASHQIEIDLAERAEKLKQVIHDELWSDEYQWWFFKDSAGKEQLRYTIQLFKLIGSGAINNAEEHALISHLNEREFLGDFGMHSMSKLDPAYDQIDIDNGGGGACSIFPPQIIERLYKAGYAKIAEDILQRILWWGERLPYWGDSLVANAIDYRKDTPLQNAIGAVSGAQMIIFGMFGVSADFEGNITVNPSPPSSSAIALTELKLRGQTIDISVEGNRYQVKTAKSTFEREVGTPLIIPAAQHKGEDQ
jgi:hypothetical protein